MSNILIISYYFPPYPKVGGRRWAKFAKYLHRKGHFVSVLCLSFIQDIESPWDNDIIEYKNEVHRIKKSYDRPFHQKKIPQNIIEKLIWIVSVYLFKFKSFLKKGNPLDVSEKYVPDFTKQIAILFRKKVYNNVIISVGPFHYAFPLIENIKKNYPNTKCILDVRDFWEDWMLNLPARKRRYEKQLEEKTFKKADLILTPAERIKLTFEEKYPILKDKFKTLSHAFDHDDFINLNFNQSNDTNEDLLRIAYFGTLYENLEPFLKNIAHFLLKLNQNGIKATLDIYSFRDDYKNYFKEQGVGQYVIYKAVLPQKELFQKIHETYQYTVYARTGIFHDSHFLSSKFFDLIALKKTIIYIGPEGDVSEFLAQNELGFHLNSNNIDDCILKLTSRESRISIKKETSDSYSFIKITDQLAELLNNDC